MRLCAGSLDGKALTKRPKPQLAHTKHVMPQPRLCFSLNFVETFRYACKRSQKIHACGERGRLPYLLTPSAYMYETASCKIRYINALDMKRDGRQTS